MTNPQAPAREETRSPFRQMVEFLVGLVVAVLLFRTFEAEAFIVPTGSMAPTLVGRHCRVRCPACQYPFAVGADLPDPTHRVVCPNCQWDDIKVSGVPVSLGDRLLVQKDSFAWRRPRRWEVAVFRCPADPSVAYVKRVVGLPGESLEIRGGDVYIDGQIARKDAADLHALCQLVYDDRYRPGDAGWRSRWRPRPGSTGWRPHGAARRCDGHVMSGKTQWLEYRHWVRGVGDTYISDLCAYNGNSSHTRANWVRDIMLVMDVTVLSGPGHIEVELTDGTRRFLIHFGLQRADAWVQEGRLKRQLATRECLPVGRPVRLEISWVDSRLLVVANGRSPFGGPYDLVPLPATGARVFSPVAIGCRDGQVEVGNLRLYRDIHYTASVPGGPASPTGVGRPIRLRHDEYFVLGDNSPISNDSRCWGRPPLLTGFHLIGKPFVVHLPSQALTVRVLQRDLTWSIPDWQRIRLIR